jgi:hypothetical protein
MYDSGVIVSSVVNKKKKQDSPKMKKSTSINSLSKCSSGASMIFEKNSCAVLCGSTLNNTPVLSSVALFYKTSVQCSVAQT